MSERKYILKCRKLCQDFINEIFTISNDFVPYILDFSRDRKNTVCVRYYEYRLVNGEWFISKRNTYLDLKEFRVKILFDELYRNISAMCEGRDMHTFTIDVDMRTDPATLKKKFSIKDYGEFKDYGVLVIAK